MIETLDQLTIGKFIDLVCGDTSVLHGKMEVVSPVKLTTVMRNIVFEYKEIVDNSGMKGYISEVEEYVKARMSIVVYSMCMNLVLLKEYTRAREVLSECGIRASSMTDARVEAEVKSQLERAKYNVLKIEEENKKDSSSTVNIRKEFDALTAALMAYFKFQIDTDTMKATVYAHLVARHNKEIKAQIDALKRK